MKDQNRFYIRTLSPLHIGCDDVYEPIGFVVDEVKESLTAFDPLDFFQKLSLKDRVLFASICQKGTLTSLLELNQFMRGRTADGHQVKTCRGFIDHYKKNLSIKPTDEKKIQQELSKFTIYRTAFHEHTKEPYIPGSSIKGALRTAYLNEMQALKKLPAGQFDAKKMEIALLDGGSFTTDPFRLLKVSDFVMRWAKTRIIYAVNEKKKDSKFPARGPYQILEIIEPGAIFTGSIDVEERYADKEGIKRPLTMETILQSASWFYGKEKQREDDELKAVGLPVLKTDNIDGGFLIRVGRHSGAESVTIEGHRKIKILQANNKPATYSRTGATTFWLAADVSANWDKRQLQPFGWALLGRLEEELITKWEKTRVEGQKITDQTSSEMLAAPTLQASQALESAPPKEEIWEDAYLSFNAGGGGILTATAKTGKKAEKRIGNDRTLISDDLLNRIKKKKGVTAGVTVRKLGNAFEIIKVETL